jgi:hypothetical protein
MPCETRPNREHFARGGVRESAACDTPLVARALRTRNHAWHDKKQNAARGRATGLNYCTTELSEAGRQFNDGIHQAASALASKADMMTGRHNTLVQLLQALRRDPDGGSAEQSLRRSRDGKQPLFCTGGCGQLEPDRHPGAITSDRHGSALVRRRSAGSRRPADSRPDIALVIAGRLHHRRALYDPLSSAQSGISRRSPRPA